MTEKLINAKTQISNIEHKNMELMKVVNLHKYAQGLGMRETPSYSYINNKLI